ncbi:MAG: ribbon-helix-helix domain-containing protein [Candidatus Dormibacteria bacterium]
MATQLAIRLSDQTLETLDRLISAGKFANRTEAIRVAVDTLITDSERREAEAAIVAGYQRMPDSATDAWLDSATTAMVSAEPW